MLLSRKDTQQGSFFFPSAKGGMVIPEKDKETDRQAGTARYSGVSLLQPNPLAFEDRPNILFTLLPPLAEAHTRKITGPCTGAHMLHKAQRTV